LLGNTEEDYSSVHEGIITPVYKGFSVGGQSIEIDGTILGSATVDNLGIIVTKHTGMLVIYRFKIENDVVTLFEKFLDTEQYNEVDNLKSVSIVLYKELDNVIKAYIATGVWPMLTIRVDNDTPKMGDDISIDSLINNRIIPTKPIYIDKVISGQLKTSQV